MESSLTSTPITQTDINMDTEANIDITEDLNLIKSEVLSLSSEYKEIITLINEKNNQLQQSDLIADEILSLHPEVIVTVDFGGKFHQTYLKNFLKYKDNFFYKYLVDRYATNKDIATFFFIDRDPFFSTLIFNYLRTGQFIINGYSNREINQLQNDFRYLGLWDALKLTTTYSSEVRCVSYKSSQLHVSCKTPNAKILHIKGNKGGIAVNSPFTITLQLMFEVEVKRLTIQGFNLNSSSFSPSNGSNAIIYVGKTENTMIKVGNLPSNYGATITTIDLNTVVLGKYISFVHTTHIGIGFLKVN